MLRTRILTALILLGVLGTALFRAPPLFWMGLVGVVVLLSLWEWCDLSGIGVTGRVIYFTLSVLWVWWIGFKGERADTTQALLQLISALFWVGLVPFWLTRRWRLNHPTKLAITGWIVILPTGYALLTLRNLDPWTLLLFMGIVWVSDTCAYFAGRSLGRHKLAPEISPGKTWEGVAGAFLGVGLYALYFWHGAAQSTELWAKMLHRLGYLWFALVFLLTVLGILGDLFESWIKRCAGVKDSGKALPGHGGILDRIDALTATLPLAALLASELT